MAPTEISAKRAKYVLNSACITTSNRYHRPDYKDTVIVLAGPNKVAFTVHTHQLTENSKFFEAACSARWTTSGDKDKPIRVPEVSGDMFTAYVHWAYTGELVSELCADIDSRFDWPLDPRQATYELDCRYRRLLQIYIAGDFLQNEQLRNKVMDELVKFEKKADVLPSTASISYIWTNTKPGSPARRWLVDIEIASGSPNAFREQLPNMPSDYVSDVATALMEARWPPETRDPGKCPEGYDRCMYHEHPADKVT